MLHAFPWPWVTVSWVATSVAADVRELVTAQLMSHGMAGAKKPETRGSRIFMKRSVLIMPAVYAPLGHPTERDRYHRREPRPRRLSHIGAVVRLDSTRAEFRVYCPH